MAHQRGQGRSRHDGRGMGFGRLRELAEKDGKEILNIVSNKQSGFHDVLGYKNLKPDWVRLILTISSKACQYADQPLTGHSGLSATSGKLDHSKMPSALLMTFLNLVRTSEFFSRHLLGFISAALTDQSIHQGGRFVKTAKDILLICKMKLSVMPNNTLHVIPVITTLQMVVRMLHASGTIPGDPELDNMLREVSDLNEDLIKLKRDENDVHGIADKRPKKQKYEREPPNNFRELSIFPIADDLQRAEIYLRRNKDRGHFDSVEQYLDIHFRLMREDFMQPLREGITHYLDTEKENMGKRVKNIRIYQNVYILHPVCSSEGVCYQIQFDSRRLSGVKWEMTKRLIYGAMVCLSPDSFKTTYFATISHREPDELKNGKVEIRFQNGTEEREHIDVNQKLVMAESPAYFEAYRHVLLGLQETNEDNLPFIKYFINCNKKVDAPEYLLPPNQNTNYDLRPLVDDRIITTDMNEAEDEYFQDSDSEDDQRTEADDHDVQLLESARAVPMMSKVAWPGAETFHLDNSQMNALRTALSSELAIIQGPPGTGKTYVGLKLVRALLQNSQYWKANESSPILLICYTNHALDQFLEGICRFLKHGIVRVGGRSKSEVLERFYLRELRKGLRERKDIPVDVHRARMDAMDEMDKTKAEIHKHVADLKASKEGVVHEDILESFMEDRHFHQLLNARGAGPRKNTTFIQWLGLQDGRAVELYDVLHAKAQKEEINVDGATADPADDVDIGNDVKAEEEQRMIQGDEYHEANQDELKQRRIMDAALKRLAVQFEDLHILKHSQKKNKQHQDQEKQAKHKIKLLLNMGSEVAEEDVMNVEDIWQLRLENRWDIYRYWLQKYKDSIHEELHQCEEGYELASRRLSEVKMQEDMQVMRRATILAMTTTGAARYREVLQQIQPRLVIVEEAAEIMEAHIVSALTPGCKHLILIGDHKQLRPNPTVYKLAETYKLKISLFERLVTNGLPFNTLEWQHRMRPSISKMLHHIYDNLKDHESVKHYERIKGISSELFFIDHDHEEITNEDLQSKINHHEAEFLVSLCKYLTLQGYSATQITILTPYTGQVREIRRMMRAKHIDKVRCSAIDNFQGEENDIILVSLVRSNSEGMIGFLKENNRICVTLSRAKKAMYIIGNAHILSAVSDLWSKMVKTLRSNEQFGKDLELYCQNHPRNRIHARTADDFNKAPEGGCEEPCGKRLECGHVCVRMCHTYDRNHEEYKCRKLCNKKLCPQNHRCQKLCFQDCGRCPVMQKRRMPNCNHIQEMPCYEPSYTHKCTAACEHTLPCRHRCQNRCGEAHTKHCEEMVRKKLPCGHSSIFKCSDRENICPEKCKQALKCEHPCTGSCGTCFEGRLHEPCTSDCGRILVCGHQCQEPCTRECPPCKARCENRCAHSICQQTCGTPCVPCIEPCAWVCEHYQCTKLCYEPCDRPRCDEPCRQRLPCGHRCIGLCGEPCPQKCRICDKDDVQEIFFGVEDEETAQFVQLEDCGHLVEVSGLDHWMDQAQDITSGSVNIKLKSCPKCSTSIRRNLRYGSLIKATLTDIEQVKKRILSDTVSPRELFRKLGVRYPDLLGTNNQVFTVIQRRVEERPDQAVTTEEVVCIENTTSFLYTVRKITEDLKAQKDMTELESLKNDIRCMKRDIEDLKRWLLKPRHRLSDQETDEANNEVVRIQLLFRVLFYKYNIQLRSVKLPPIIDGRLQRVYNTLCQRSPFQKEEEMRTRLDEIKEHVPLSGLGISDEERKTIVAAIGLKAGHWYKCPKGHVYAIGDCGGATVESKCPECGSTIGGANHSLRADNALASEMDGATRSAWPTGLMR